MQQTSKYYPNRYTYGKLIQATVKWTPQFLETIEEKFGLNGNFTANNVASIFQSIVSLNAARLKLLRLYRIGWFTRTLEEGIYVYRFSNSARNYYRSWQGFENEESPLVTARKPKYVRETIESQKEISDMYIREI